MKSDTRSDAGTARARLVRNTPLLLAATAVLVLVAAAGFLFAPGRTTGAATEPLLAVQDIVASG